MAGGREGGAGEEGHSGSHTAEHRRDELNGTDFFFPMDGQKPEASYTFTGGDRNSNLTSSRLY